MPISEDVALLMRRTTFPDARTAYVIAALAGLFALFAMRRADPDLWGYLAYGRYFAELGHPTAVDVFSYTCRECTWIHFEWLAHVSLWVFYDAAGAAGLIALKCVIGAICLGYVFSAVSMAAKTPAAWLPVYLLAIGIVPRYFLFRPQFYTFALLAVFVAAIWKHLSGPGRIWHLAPLTAVWANLHGGFLAGLGVIGLGMLLSAVRDWSSAGRLSPRFSRSTLALAVLLVAAALSSLVNPLGWRLWTYLFTEITHDTNRQLIAEWMPLLQSRDAWSIATTLLLLTLLAVGGGVAQQRREAPLGIRPLWWLLSCVPLTLMAFESVRHVPILTIWAAPVLAAFGRSLIDVAAGTLRQLVWRVVPSLMAVPAILTAFLVAQNPRLEISLPPGVLGSTEPFGAVTYMKATGMQGNLFLPLWWGSYATAQLFPHILVSMDGRNVSLYPRDMVLENLLFFTSPEGDIDAPWQYSTDFLLVPRDAPVFSRVSADSRWRPQFEDDDAVLFARKEPNSRVTPHVSCRFARPATFALTYAPYRLDELHCDVAAP